MSKNKKYNVDSQIRNALRRVWLYSPMRKEALSKARFAGSPAYLCALCSKIFPKNGVEVDHVVECGVLSKVGWSVWIERLFSGELRVLCKPCHKARRLNG